LLNKDILSECTYLFKRKMTDALFLGVIAIEDVKRDITIRKRTNSPPAPGLLPLCLLLRLSRL
jgi:hypothetical protein